MLYDGLCRVCLTNKALLESRDRRGQLRFVDIAAASYNASQHAGVDYSDAMDELHIILPGGEVVRGTAAVFRAYQAVGLGWAVGILGSPPLRWLTDQFYKLLSKNRRSISVWLPGARGSCRKASQKERAATRTRTRRRRTDAPSQSGRLKTTQDNPGRCKGCSCTVAQEKVRNS